MHQQQAALSAPVQSPAFGFILTVARNLRRLIFLPILVGGAVGFTHFIGKGIYTSESYLAMSAEDARQVSVLMRAPMILDVVLGKYREDASTLERQREILDRKFRIVPAKGARKEEAKLHVLEVDDKDPARAQSVNNLLIDTWLESSKPTPELKILMEIKIKNTEERLRQTNGLLAKLQTESPNVINFNLKDELASSTSRLFKSAADAEDMLLDLKTRMRGTPRDIVLKSASLPTKIDVQIPIILAILAALLTGLVMLLVLSLSYLTRLAREDAEVAAKIEQLKNAWGRKRVVTGATAN